jgi:hypothetical protein
MTTIRERILQEITDRVAGTAGINRFTLALFTSNQTITVQSNAYTRWGAAINLSATRTNHLMFRGNGTSDWTVIQIP